MNKYQVKLMAKAARDLNDIYEYIVSEFKDMGTAEKLIDIQFY
ncbi:hypothetical protein [Anaeromicropila herbilytica]|uniref:Type II toxin-antitoxin system RelE/ParE family toxin n=1 Tax=Anaeromicropila herbilytica TaxID=2785025 RepID=A0A7R7EIB4_9FIRM|nr:hypothetical protein [Anaeromicropila herbilytica]BCN29240.1 hypothetical protein bsdtb5_05350 [Anaeromicropila herbilytica]